MAFLSFLRGYFKAVLVIPELKFPRYLNLTWLFKYLSGFLVCLFFSGVHLDKVPPSIFAYNSQSSSLQCNYDIAEHEGLISRPGLRGKKQDASLTSTGLYCYHESKTEKPTKPQLYRLLWSDTEQSVEYQSSG